MRDDMIAVMALTLQDPEVEALVFELAELTGESATEALRKAVLDRIQLTRSSVPKKTLQSFLETEIWPAIPPDVLGRDVSRSEVEDYLGIGPGGV